jgi:hypothetical protein
MKKYSDPDPGSGIKHPGSATLVYTLTAQRKKNDENITFANGML